MAGVIYIKGVRTRFQNTLTKEIDRASTVIRDDDEELDLDVRLRNITSCIEKVTLYEEKFKVQSEKFAIALEDDADQIEKVVDEDYHLCSQAVDICFELEKLHKILQHEKEKEESKEVVSSTHGTNPGTLVWLPACCYITEINVEETNFVLQDGLAKPVNINGRQVEVKTISVQDADDEIKVSLWRDLAQREIQLGDIVEVTHVVVNEKRYNWEESLSTTQFSEIKRAELPTEEATYEALGIEVEDITSQLMTCEHGVLSCSTESLLTHFLCTLEELPEKFPCDLTVRVKGQEIVQVL